MTDCNQIYTPPKHIADSALVSSMDEYRRLYNRSIEDPDGFWTDMAKEKFHWETWGTADDGAIHRQNFDVRNGKISVEWFPKCRTNLCYNAVDRHVEAGRGTQVAFHWEGNDPSETRTITYNDLLHDVSRCANALRALGVDKGDCVVMYMPMIPELAVALLACARIGAVHNVVFAGFSAEALSSRILDSKAAVVLTADGSQRGPKVVRLKHAVDAAVQRCAEQGHNVRKVMVVEHLGDGSGTMGQKDVSWATEMQRSSTECAVEWMNAEDPLFMLYTSGSTGRPKGVLHTTGGYMVWAGTTFRYVFDYQRERGDVYFCTADIGWITGHSYIVYGPLLNGATSVLFEGVPFYPHPDRLWRIVDKYCVTQFYTAPTAIRSLMRLGNAHVTESSSRETLRILGTVGEPINPEAWRWYAEVIGGGHCTVADTWWQTETGGIMIAPLPGATPTKPGSATLPMFGIEPVVLNDKGQVIEDTECSGYLAVRRSWPGIMRTVFGDHKRFENTYFASFPGYYLTGDGCRRDADGYYWLTGRIDDVVNVSGHRLGTAEVESALVAHPAVAEAAVVGCPDDIKGESIYAYVTLREGQEYSDEMKTQLRNQVRKVLGPIATPGYIHWAVGMPKTRSGKIMRRILRKIAANEYETLGDTTTLADPSVIDTLIESKNQ